MKDTLYSHRYTRPTSPHSPLLFHIQSSPPSHTHSPLPLPPPTPLTHTLTHTPWRSSSGTLNAAPDNRLCPWLTMTEPLHRQSQTTSLLLLDGRESGGSRVEDSRLSDMALSLSGQAQLPLRSCADALPPHVSSNTLLLPCCISQFFSYFFFFCSGGMEGDGGVLISRNNFSNAALHLSSKEGVICWEGLQSEIVKLIGLQS